MAAYYRCNPSGYSVMRHITLSRGPCPAACLGLDRKISDLRRRRGGDGTGKRTRTSDPRITNALLYQLRYPGARHAESRAFYIFLRSLMTRSMPATSVPGGGGGRRLNATAG